jgi:hypothetical protein
MSVVISPRERVPHVNTRRQSISRRKSLHQQTTSDYNSKLPRTSSLEYNSSPLNSPKHSYINSRNSSFTYSETSGGTSSGNNTSRREYDESDDVLIDDPTSARVPSARGSRSNSSSPKAVVDTGSKEPSPECEAEEQATVIEKKKDQKQQQTQQHAAKMSPSPRIPEERKPGRRRSEKFGSASVEQMHQHHQSISRVAQHHSDGLSFWEAIERDHTQILLQSEYFYELFCQWIIDEQEEEQATLQNNNSGGPGAQNTLLLGRHKKKFASNRARMQSMIYEEAFIQIVSYFLSVISRTRIYMNNMLEFRLLDAFDVFGKFYY